MKVIVMNKKVIFYIALWLWTSLFLVVYFKKYHKSFDSTEFLMGATYAMQSFEAVEEIEVGNTQNESSNSLEKYFRSSHLPILNDRKVTSAFFHNSYGKEPYQVIIPNELLKTPEDTILNYYSILREAANPEKGKYIGCGTIGFAKTPYPIAYHFLTPAYQEKLNYDQYLQSFKNILHLNLIKLKEIPSNQEDPNINRYFIELETIEGSEKDIGYFGYYYGYVYILKESASYQISDIQLYGENYLCAPYHGWDYMAEAVIDIKYGGWCSLVKERYPTEQEGYVKKIYFKGTDGNDYLFVFFELTNGTDIEIAQYKKDAKGQWKLIKIDPEKCLEKE